MAGYDDKAARRQLEEILASNQKKTRALAKGVADSVLARAQSSSDPISQILTDVFRAQDVSGRMRKIVGPAVVQSVAAGYGVLPSVGYQPSAPVVDKALSMRWDPKSMPNLSAQVHGTAQAYRQDLEDSLRTSFAQSKTVQQAARAIYDGYQPGLRATGPFAAITPAIPARGGNAPAPHLPQVIRDGVNAASILSPGDKIRFKKYADAIIGHAEQMKLGPLRASYMELAQSLEKAGQKGLERAIRVATEEKARYHADRIARTESARAWDAGFRARIDEDPRVVGIKSRTSSAHKAFDICDFHARADMYGMGEGCYPKDRAPEYPYHPHCTCNRSPIYRRRPSSPPPRAGGPDVDAGAKTLQGMTDQERRALLSAHGAKTFGMDPGSWTRTMRNLAQPGGADPAIAAAKVVVDLVKLEALPLVERAIEEEKLIWRNAGFETGVILREGEAPIRIVGGPTSVTIPFDMGEKLRGAVFTHNHPLGWGYPKGSSARNGNSFSPADLRLGNFWRAKSVRAVTPIYAYHLDYNGSHPLTTTLEAASKAADAAVLARAEKPEPGNWYHEINLLIAKRFGWTYSREEHGHADDGN